MKLDPLVVVLKKDNEDMTNIQRSKRNRKMYNSQTKIRATE